jgi:hypothetical protein
MQKQAPPPAPAQKNVTAVEPDMPSQEAALPLGCVTGTAKDVLRIIARAAVSLHMMRFLLEMHTRSFGNAGYQRRAGSPRPGSSCPFNNAEWARELGLARQNLFRLRVQAVALGMVTYAPNATDQSVGRLTWNLDFDAWVPLQAEYRKQRNTRLGAGRTSESVRTPASEACVDDSKSVRTPASETCVDNSKSVRTVARGESNRLHSSASGEFKSITPAHSEARHEAVPLHPEERVTEEKILKKRGVTYVTPRTPAAQSAPDVAGGEVASLETAEGPQRHLPPSSRSAPAHTVAPEQNAARYPRQAWCTDLLNALRAELRVERLPLPLEERERRDAHWFYRALRDEPDGIGQVMACYRLTKRLPLMERGHLSLYELRYYFRKYSRDPSGYQSMVERQREAAAKYAKRSPSTRSRRHGAPTEPTQYPPADDLPNI